MEKWKFITWLSYPYIFKVSSRGRIKCLKTVYYKNNKRIAIQKGIITPSFDSAGYPQVVLRLGNKPKLFRVHSIVLITFVGPKPPGMECRHLNDVKTDNRLKNLCWGTRQQNRDDCQKNGNNRGGSNQGEMNGNRKLTWKKVNKIRKLFKNGWNTYELSTKFKTDYSNINLIVRNKTWKHCYAEATF